MPRPRPEDFARNFPGNGTKLLLRAPANVQGLLRFGHSPLVDRIEYNRLRVDETTYVQRDYRHVESDIVLRGVLGDRRRAVAVPDPDAYAAVHQPARHAGGAARVGRGRVRPGDAGGAAAPGGGSRVSRVGRVGGAGTGENAETGTSALEGSAVVSEC